MRLAIISDIHANVISLDAVLDALAREGIERGVCLGDVAAGGPQPREVLARLRELGWPVVLGNVDSWVLDPQPFERQDEDARRMEEIDRWSAALLTPEDREYLGAFHTTFEMTLESNIDLLCFHGSPRSNTEIIDATTPTEELAARLGGKRATVMAGGHTHEQMLRRYQESIVINPGSVGLTYELLANGSARNPPWAEYAVITCDQDRLSIDLRRLPVDVDAIRAAILSCGMPHAAWWAGKWG